MKKILLLFLMVLGSVSLTFAQTPAFYNSTAGTSSNAFPLNTASSNKVQWIYGPGQFSSTGGGTGTPSYLGLIDTLWYRTTSTANASFAGFEISLGQTVGTQTAWANGTYVTGLTSCVGPGAMTSTAPYSGGWVPFVLTTPFFYNPALSLVVEMRQNGYTPGLQSAQQNIANTRIWGGYAATSGSFGSGLVDMGMSLFSPLNCATPTAGTASFIGTDSIALSWTENNMPAATTWQIEYGPAGFTPTGTPQITTTTNPHGIGGLTQNTPYDFHIRAYCGPNDSSYYHMVSATTLATCAWPTNATVTMVPNGPGVDVTFDWTENNMPAINNWDLYIGPLNGPAPTPATPASVPGLPIKPFTIPSFPGNTCYEYYVRTNCGAINGVSQWTGPIAFCTPSLPLNCPVGNPSVVWSEDFITAPAGQSTLPNAAAPGWTRSGTGPFWSVDEGGTTSGSTGPVTGAKTPGYVYLESSTAAGTDTLISPLIDLSGVVGAARLKYFYHMYGSSTDSIWLFIDNGTTSTLAWEEGGQQHTSSTDPYDSVIIDLNSYVGQSITLKFAGRRNIGFANDMALDDFEIEGCVACAAVSNLNVDTAFGTGATISWTDNNTPTSTAWHLEVVPSGTTPTGVATDTSLTNPATITGLSPFTSYDVYVRPDCDTSGLGGWTGPVSFVACSPLAGTYTVDPSLPASVTNFQTLNAVAVALDCGISAPVVFDMAPGASFNEQVIFDEVIGASKINTVTFNGNGDTVFYAATVSADRHTIRLDGADFFTFNDVVVQATGTTGFAMHLFNSGGDGTDCNTFKRCTFTCPTTSTSSVYAAFTASGSLTSLFTASSGGTPDSNIVDSCNTIGGYCAIGMYGKTSAPYSSGNQFTNNVMEDFAIYGTYFLYHDDMLFSKNDISRATRTSLSTFYGIYASGVGNRNLFEKNCIHDPAGANPAFNFTGYFVYMLMDASSAANANVIQNNVVLDNQGNGTHYGLYLNNAYNLRAYHNTVVHNSTTAATGITRGIYQQGTTTLLGLQDIQNNNVVVTRNTTGACYGVYKQYATATVDYNNVYGTTANFNYGFNGANQATLAAWQASTPTVGANSVSVDPLFTITPASGCDFTPGNAGMNDLGNPALGVLDDHFDSVRSAAPDMGAFEFTVAPTDIATTNIIAPDTSIGCYTATDTITVEITNVGATTHDFSVNPTTVTVQVNGPSGPSTHTATVNTDTLATLGALNVVLTPTVDLTVNGVYTFDAYQTTVGDPTATNDTLATYTYNVNLVPGVLTASPDILCVSGTSDVSLAGNAGGIIQWQTSATGMAPWGNVGAGMNPHTSATLTATTYYRALLTCNSNIDSTNVDTIIVNNPMILTTMGDTICGADTATVMATSNSATINWYSDAIAGTLIDTGGTLDYYTTMTDTLYAAALDGAGKVLITEVCGYDGLGAGWVAPTHPSMSALSNWDPIELTNIGTAPVDISGWKLEITGASAGSVIIPAGNIIPPNSAFVIGRGTVGTSVPGIFLANVGLPTASSGSAHGVILSDASAAIQDVMSINNYAVVGTGTPAATAADWSGTTPATGGTAGLRRTVVDDTNLASDWTAAAAGTNPVNYGDVNVAYTPAGCEGVRVPVIIYSLPATPITATNDTTVCWDGSVMVPLTATSTNTGYTYTWAPALGLSATTGATVNANPLTATQYIVTGVDATGCGNTDTINIAVQPEHWTTATASLTAICGSDTVDLLATDSVPAPSAYCASGATNAFDTKIDTVSFAGVTVGTSPSAQETYTDNTTTIIPAAAGVALPLSIVNGSSSGFYYGGTVTVYIDYDQSGTFDAGELVYTFATTALNTIPATTVTIPTSALNGQTRMRIVLPESSPSVACGTWVYGETEDYTVDISGATTVPPPVYTYSWNPGALAGAAQAVAPTATTTYTVAQTDVYGCAATDSVVITAGPVSGILALATASNAASMTGNTNQTAPHADGATVSYYDASCNLIAMVNDGAGGNVLGSTMSEVTVDATVQNHNGQPYTRRWYEITPTSNGPADVTIYQTQADFNDYNIYATANGWPLLPIDSSDAAGIANARVAQISGGTLGVGTAVQHTPATMVWDSPNQRWALTFPVTGFSEFYTHTVNPGNVVLPVTLTKFNVTKEGSVSFAAWMTSSEQNNSHFNLQRSLDGNDFTTLGKVNTKAMDGNSTTELNYDFTDAAPQIGHNYYRLEQVDQDGNLSYSKIVDVVWGADGSVVTIYPNPATDKLNVDVSIDKVAQLEVRLLDMSGRVVKSVMQQTNKGMNNVTLDLSDIASGVYGVQIIENNNLIHTSKVNKQSK